MRGTLGLHGESATIRTILLKSPSETERWFFVLCQGFSDRRTGDRPFAKSLLKSQQTNMHSVDPECDVI